MAITDDFVALIKRMDGSFIRDYSYMVNKTVAAKALKTVDPDTQAKIIDNLPSGEGEALKDLLAGMGPVPLEEVEAAQREILSMAQGYV